MQGEIPREVKDIIRNVQQMDLPENGIADIRIKIQGGDVMDRPMFKKGGGANKFPDLSGDGKVTQKDILIGRGVIEKQEGGAVNPEQAVAQVEMAAEAEGEQLGLDYLAQQMGGIDMAEDAESLINALRGNEMPISARRTELAEYVGEEDAMRTPESVLAMVQPTIMMTEEGAMNSGIGELMQQLTSDVEMATEGGAPTDMGQGVGALMMAGSPQEQPVQQFAAGGPVQRLSNGGPPGALSFISQEVLGDLKPVSAQQVGDLFPERRELYRQLIGQDDTKKQRALDLAQAGFAFASGVDPRTGQNIAGRPFLSQIGAVGGDFAQKESERLAERRKLERGLEIAALEAAEREATAAAAARRDRETQLLGAKIAAGTQAESLEADKNKYTFLAGERRANLQTQLDASLNELMTNLESLEFRQRESLDEAMKRLVLEKKEDYDRTMDLTALQGKIQEERDYRVGEIAERSAMMDQTRWVEKRNKILADEKVLLNIKQIDYLERLDKQLKNRLTEISSEQDFTRELRQIDKETQEDLMEQRAEINEDFAEFSNDLLGDERDRQFRLKKDLYDLNIAQFELQQGQFDFAREKYGKDLSMQELRDQVQADLAASRIRAQDAGVDLAELKFRVDTGLARRGQDLAYFQSVNRQRDQELERLSAPLFKDDQMSYINDPANIRAYAAGEYVPGFEQLLGKYFGEVIDPITKQKSRKPLPSELQSALRKRAELGVTGPYAQFGIAGFQQGGAVDGFREPLSGEFLPMQRASTVDPDLLAERKPRPMITDVPGVDLTEGTGAFASIASPLNRVTGAIDDLFGSDIGPFSEQVEKAVPAINALNQMTLISGLESIAGRQNVQLQERLASLNVPAAEFLTNDKEALEKFRTFDRVLGSTIDVQQDIIDAGGLAPRDVNKARVELNNLLSLKAEYENIVQKYERSLGEGQKTLDEELEQFFIK